MSDENKNNPDREIRSDKGSWPLSNKGQQPPPPSSEIPKLKKPKK